MITLPEYLTTETEDMVRQRMLDVLPADLDKSEGSYIYDAIAPAAIELSLAATWAQEVLRRGFASTTFGQYLDNRCAEHGLTRRAAVSATGQVKFTGTPGTVIGIDTIVATPADAASSATSVFFKPTAEVTLDGNGIVYANIVASEPGGGGNVLAGTISMLVTPVSGVSTVNNETATTGGMDTEDDSSLLARYLQRVRTPSAGGNKADYDNWAMEVPGVGGVSVIPIRDGAGTVSVAIIDSDKKPAAQALIDTVQNYIAPPWVYPVEAETMTLGGLGVSIDNTLTDDAGDSVKMVYNATGAGTVNNALDTLPKKPGIWQVRPIIKVDNVSGTSNLLQVGVWNKSASTWAKTRPGGLTDAVKTIRACDLKIAFDDYQKLEFYWNAQDQMELRITRLQTDTTTIAWVDHVVYRSTFSKDNGEGKAPVGARVTVEPAKDVTVDISAALTIISGYDANSVKAQVETNLSNYVKSLAFQSDNDVRYVRVGQTILDTEGVQDYSNLLVNNGTANKPVDVQEVAVLGSVTLT